MGETTTAFLSTKSKRWPNYVDYRKKFKYSVSDGNPLSYYNGADYTFTWEQGRQLASVTKGNKTASYTYDMSGVRSGKTVNGVSYEYTTLSGKITRMTWSGNAVDIVYDDAGRPYILRYTPSGGATQTYYYVLNLQGDVVGLMNTSMQMVVKYSYDPWGKLTGTNATSAYVALAQANPLRYRSYCYDIETGFYYLQTRYYDPTIARFINADGYLSTDSTGLLSYNMFAYCENNPVMYSDPAGESVSDAISALREAIQKAVHRVQYTYYTLDDRGNGTIYYNVDLFDQGDTELCWASCQVMYESYRDDRIHTQSAADARAKELGIMLNGEAHWSDPGWPFNAGDYIEVDSIETLYDALQDGPVYAFYRELDSSVGHLVLVTGVSLKHNVVFTNNPNDCQDYQEFIEFLIHHTTNQSYDQPLIGCFAIN